MAERIGINDPWFEKCTCRAQKQQCGKGREGKVTRQESSGEVNASALITVEVSFSLYLSSD